MSMSLDEFVAAEIQHIQRFADYWRDENAVNAKEFPMRMGEGNEGAWAEQLAAFNDGTDPDNDVITKDQAMSKYDQVDIPVPILGHYSDEQILQILKDEQDGFERRKAKEITARIHRIASEKRIEYVRAELQKRNLI